MLKLKLNHFKALNVWVISKQFIQTVTFSMGVECQKVTELT